MGKYGSRRLPRSAGPEDVHPGWLEESAERSIGPYINYRDGTVTERATGKILWRPGDDPAKRPINPAPEPYDKRVSGGYFGGWRSGPLRRRNKP